MKKLVFILIVQALVFAGCDIIEDPTPELGFFYNEDLYGPPPAFSPTPAEEIFKRVVIEDFTGHECGNCPIAHDIAADLDTLYGDSLAVIAVHVTDLAAPNLPDFPADYRTTAGDAWWSPFDGLGIPIGRINRSGGLANPWPYTLWDDEAAAQFAQDPRAVLQMKLDFVADNRDLNIHVQTEFLEALAGSYNLAVVILESYIVSPQLEYLPAPFVWDAYYHNHMLRGSVSGPFGIQVASNPAAGTSQVNSYTFEWNENWLPEHCSVLAMLINNATGEIENSVETYIAE